MSKKTIKKIPNVPNLRFSEFTDSWLKRRFDEIADFYKGTGISKDQLSLEGNECILYGELYTTYKTETIDEIKSKTNIDTKGLFFGKKNDVIIPASGETPIDIATSCCVCKDNILFGGDLNIIRLKTDNGSFISCQLNGKRKIDIAKIAQGASIVHLHNDDLKKIYLYTPIDLKEQTKIVELFTLIDKRIRSQSKIIDDIESLIKGIRYQIFATKKHQFTDTKLFLLGDFLTEYSKKNNNNNLRSASIGKYGIRMRDEIYSKDLTNDYSKNKVIFKDTLSIGMGSTQIDIGILSEDEKYCISPAYTTYKIANINSKYLNEYLIYLNPLLSKRYMVVGARQGKSVNKAELLNHELMIHSKQEQLEIVKIFSSLFNKLQKEKDILSLYKKQKAYLLQNMFI